MITKPMLAGKLDSEDQVVFPVLVTPKLDGIRCLVIDGKALTRKFKPIPNHYIRTQIERFCPDGFDGEIMSGDLDFNSLQSLVMTEDGEPKFEYHVFDYVQKGLQKPYTERIVDLVSAVDIIHKDKIGEIYTTRAQWVKVVLPEEVKTKEDLLKKEFLFLTQGYEGIIIRSPNGPYKCGRSTIREGYLLKLKRFQDSEAEILGVENLLHNANYKEMDELGYTKRSKKKANLEPTNKLGAFNVKDLKTEVEFKVSTGMTDEQRLEYWEKGTQLVGKVLKYKYQELGPNKKPRFPVFLGFRDKQDMS